MMKFGTLHQIWIVIEKIWTKFVF